MKRKDVEGMDPALKGFCGFDIGPDETPSPDELPDAIADLAFESRWGFARPGSANAAPAKKALSREEIAQSLANLAKTLGKPGFKNTGELIAKLAEAAKLHLEENNPTRQFLESYAASDRAGMKSAVKKLVEASREEILAHLRAGGNSAAELLFLPDRKLPN